MFPSLNSEESRALQFFCEIVGPNLPGATDPFFWTHLVIQFSRYEPAVRHSVIAISSLYEDVRRAQESPFYLRNKHLKNNALALRHYNAAIKELMVMDNQGLVLLVCLLFICVEFLQSNRETALRHCAHGIAILASSDSSSFKWVRQHLVPLFRRLSALPFFFGGGPEDVLDLSVSKYPVPALFHTLSEAEDMIDDIFNQAMQLIRRGDSYRVGHKQHKTPPPELFKEQDRIRYLLGQWYDLFTRFETISTSQATRISKCARLFALARFRICRIWSSMAFNRSEMDYDQHHDEFRQLIEESSHVAALQENDSPKTSPSFEMGFIAPLFFIVMKCRFLDLRLSALDLLRRLSAPRENLWDRDGMYYLGRRIIEIEHGLVLDSGGQPSSAFPACCYGLPPEEMRVRQFIAEFVSGQQDNFHGHEIRGRKVVVFMRTPEGRIYLRPEVLTEEPLRLPTSS